MLNVTFVGFFFFQGSDYKDVDRDSKCMRFDTHCVFCVAIVEIYVDSMVFSTLSCWYTMQTYLVYQNFVMFLVQANLF